jgi:hypothetical protein
MVENARKARFEFQKFVPEVIEKLGCLAAAQTDSCNDIKEVLKVITSLKKVFPNEPGLQIAISKTLTLVFSDK